MSEIKQNITNELSEEELENIAGGFAILLWMIPDIRSR